MGNYFSRQADNEVHNLDTNVTHSYRFPPKSGSYFADSFFLAGEKFENLNRDIFLFGENSDLNYLRNKPSNYPFPSPNGDEPSNALRSLVHLRKDSLKMVKFEGESTDDDSYYIEFIFDSDVDCAVKMFMQAKEDIGDGCVKYTTKKPELCSDPVHFPKGAKQKFSSKNFTIQPGKFQPSELSYIPGEGDIPLVIQLTVEHPDFVGQSESTFAGIESLSDGGFCMKFMKQKLMIDGICLIAQEIYGIENYRSSASEADAWDKDAVDRNVECTICYENPRDTLTLPCRHLHLCRSCADEIRSSENSCPICKTSFHALLHVKAVRRKENSDPRAPTQYEEIELIDAMTGNLDELARMSSDGGGLPRRGSSAKSRRSSRGKSPKSRNEQAANKASRREGRTLQKVAVSVEASRVNNMPDVETSDSSVSLQANAGESVALPSKEHSIFIEPSNEETPADVENSDHIDASIPGTPMSCEKSSSDMSPSPSALLLNSSQRSSLSTNAILETPSNILYETKINGVDNDTSVEAEEKD